MAILLTLPDKILWQYNEIKFDINKLHPLRTLANNPVFFQKKHSLWNNTMLKYTWFIPSYHLIQNIKKVNTTCALVFCTYFCHMGFYKPLCSIRHNPLHFFDVFGNLYKKGNVNLAARVDPSPREGQFSEKALLLSEVCKIAVGMDKWFDRDQFEIHL